MIIERLYDEKLAQASYLIACGATGEAVVVDANRDTEQYVRAAEAEDVRIAYVTETHIHADYVSGSRELAAATGAKLLLSGEGGPDWQYAFAGEAGADLLREGDRFEVGRVRFDVLHTPGHTPEHLCFLVTDRAATERPIGILTGDFVFVGDVGRPDLLERAAGVADTMRDSARTLFDSLQRFLSLPDHLQVWPGHGAGSACGKSLSAVPTSTVGYEKLYNWALQARRAEEFAEAVLSGQPEPPRYFATMKRINRDGPPLLQGFRRPERLSDGRLTDALAGGALVVDTRPAKAFGSGHVPGTINIPLVRTFTTWAGWLIPYDRDFHLIVEDRCRDCIDEAVRDLAMIGLDRVAGYFAGEAVEAWRARGGELQTVPTVETEEVERRLSGGAGAVVDVRDPHEWEEGHLPGAVHVPLGHLRERAGELPRGRPVTVHCETGGRSAIAASLLQAEGFSQVSVYPDGFAGWKEAGGQVVRG